MATKKEASKKAAAKAAKPARKTPAKPARASGGKAAAAKKVKPAAKKPTTVAKKAAKPTPAKKAAPASKKSIKPAPKKTAPPKPAPAKSIRPEKKPTVAAPSQEQTKSATKPLEPAVVEKKESKPEKKAEKVVIPKTSTTSSVKYEPEFTKSVLDTPSQEGGGPTMRYSDAELAEFRELIQRKLDAAKKELAYLQGLITRKDESGDLDEGRYMTMEDGSMSMEREQLSQMASRQIQFIDHLEKALMRIENKTYGICRVTGKLIDKARLRAVPHATLSIEAKQMMNR